MKSIKPMIFISVLLLVLVYGWDNFMVSEASREVGSFSSIQVNGTVNVYLSQGNVEAVTLRADDNLHDKITITVVKGELRIFNNEFIRGERVLDVYVTYRELRSIVASGASTITTRSMMQTGSLNLTAENSADVKLQVNADTLNLRMRQVANVFLAGTTNYFDFGISHVGDLTAYNFLAKNCTAKVITGDQSPGIARINVAEELAVHLEGPRYLYYKGSPKIISEVVIGEGKLLKK